MSQEAEHVWHNHRYWLYRPGTAWQTGTRALQDRIAKNQEGVTLEGDTQERSSKSYATSTLLAVRLHVETAILPLSPVLNEEPGSAFVVLSVTVGQATRGLKI